MSPSASNPAGSRPPNHSRREEFLRLAYWWIPPVFCLVLYFYGLRAWYQQDDFAWLGQRYRIANIHDFLLAVLGPSRHGTFRPLSERLFFLICGRLFGTDAFPAHLCVFLTQLGNLALVSSIARRISGSRVAGFLAPILWTANGALAFPMAWSSAYMQILCAFSMLLAFHFFLRYIETGKRSWYLLQWLVFLIGFGVMESMIVYPAIAALYALLEARKYWRATVPLFGASLLFLALHLALVPRQPTFTYSMHFDAAMAATLGTYWKWALVPWNWASIHSSAAWLARSLRIVFTAAALGYAAWSAWRKRMLPLFGLAWFGILLCPVLPLKDHISYYYLTLPAIGIGLTGAFAAASAARRGWLDRTITAAILLLFLMVQAPYAAASCAWFYRRSQHIKDVVVAVAAVRQSSPGKTIVLTGVGDDLFYSAIWDQPFRAFGIGDVYVDPAERSKIAPDPALGDISPLFIDASVLQQLLIANDVEVLSAATPVLIDVTPRFEAAAKSSAQSMPRRLNPGSGLSQPFLRGTWYEPDGDHRWMGKSAGVVLAGPPSPGQQLHIGVYCPQAQVSPGRLTGKVAVDGREIGELSLSKGDAPFEAAFPLPQESVGKPKIEVGIQLDRTFRAPGDVRELGLVINSFEIR
ncbi:MAG: glycosyltransferase family 39 protein [Bryobacteraceae bacterium]